MGKNPFARRSRSRKIKKGKERSALGIQHSPAQQFGAVSTGILLRQVAKNKEARGQHHHQLRFNRIEQDVTWMAGEARNPEVRR
jgi:hypothetical protein